MPPSKSAARAWWLAGGVAASMMALVAMYFINPFGTATWDLRARMLGYMVYRTPAISMSPTLAPGDVVLVDAKAFMRAAPGRGDVIVFFPPQDFGSTAWISRVAAVAGERVEMSEGAVLVNGQPQPMPAGASPALGPGPGRDLEPLTVPPGHVFVLSDNRDHSVDSRYFGPVPRENLIGRMSRVMRQP